MRRTSVGDWRLPFPPHHWSNRRHLLVTLSSPTVLTQSTWRLWLQRRARASGTPSLLRVSLLLLLSPLLSALAPRGRLLLPAAAPQDCPAEWEEVGRPCRTQRRPALSLRPSRQGAPGEAAAPLLLLHPAPRALAPLLLPEGRQGGDQARGVVEVLRQSLHTALEGAETGGRKTSHPRPPPWVGLCGCSRSRVLSNPKSFAFTTCPHHPLPLFLLSIFCWGFREAT